MTRVFSNGPSKDYVINPFKRLIDGSARLHFAAPFFTQAGEILKAANDGKTIQLLIGLNEVTSPKALRKIHEVQGIKIRYLTSRFHAKIYIFDKAALLGSANLTDGGLRANREAVICLDREEDADALDEIRALFVELWGEGQVLTREKLDTFEEAYKNLNRKLPDFTKEIEAELGQAQPHNINVASREKSSERNFLETLRQEVYEQYRPAFNDVTAILKEHGFRRPELAKLGIANETNRFLNYVRRTYAIGDKSWQTAPLLPAGEQRQQIMRYGQKWVNAENSKVPEDFTAWLDTVNEVFGTRDAIMSADKEKITKGLISLHAFYEQIRFVKGGIKSLPIEFWKANNDDVDKVKNTLTYQLHGSGDFIQRFHDVLYDPSMKLKRFGYFCALELYGTVKPDECPPMNGRMAKALRFLGFDVKGA